MPVNLNTHKKKGNTHPEPFFQRFLVLTVPSTRWLTQRLTQPTRPVDCGVTAHIPLLSWGFRQGL